MRLRIFLLTALLLLAACNGQNGGELSTPAVTQTQVIASIAPAATATQVATSRPDILSPSPASTATALVVSPAVSTVAVLPPTEVAPAGTAPAGESVIPAAPTTAFNPDGFNAVAGSNFPALDDPRIVSAAEVTWLQPDDLVLGVEVNEESRAYPVMQAAYHHVINDQIAGEPYLVTF